MPVREESFRIGCGRYLQKPNLLKECDKEICSSAIDQNNTNETERLLKSLEYLWSLN